MPARSRHTVVLRIIAATAAAVALAAELSLTTGAAQADSPRGIRTSPVSPASQTSPGSPASTASPTATGTLVITLNPGDYAIGPDNPAPVVSGTVSKILPAAATPVPYAGQPVTLVDSVHGDISLTTDSSGGFAYKIISPRPGETITAQVPGDGTTAGTAAPAVSLTGQSQLAARLSPAEVKYGAKATVSGTVGFPAGRAVVPLAGQQVRIFAPGKSSPAATAVTGPGGTFTAALPREPAGLKWTVRTSGGPDLTPATATLPMTVDLPTAVTGFRASLDQYWQLTFHGCLGLASTTPGSVPSLQGLVIQYAASPAGPWRTLGAVPKQSGAACGDGGRTFTAKLGARSNSAYYRAVFAGSTFAGSVPGSRTRYASSVSKAALAWKYADRLTGFAVSAHTVRPGGKLTVRGQLQVYSGGTWHPYARQTVLVILRPQGSSTWYWIVKVATNAKGAFSATFTDPVTAVWSAEYLGDGKHLAAVAASIPVTVRR